ncbi:probable disease resistance protein At4g27220 [Gossypium arboreum]|uniref:probable disease resistance protein At4g27220 n=1 Tax=Gossypium arboreum TaxID=29729 RepID=UPI000819555A|nr:probable disease resistance protein At4g27220 [Gossypium arboreum]XP_052876945.1 probable disease resistance protein At4g27220 [Gossypium arboreum]
MAELVGPILEVIKFIGRPARKYLKYHRKFTEYVADFKQAQDDLLAKKADIQRQLDEECDHGKMPKQEVERWFKKVEEKLAHAQNVEDKVSKGKCLFRSSLGKLVDETTQALKEVQAEGNFSGRLVVNDPSIVAVKLPTENLVGHQVSVRDEIYGYLMGDEVGRIGVCGMGGIGKTTIMKDVYNRLIREAKFKKLIWITVSRNLDIQSIQKDIASQLKRALPDHENTTVRAGKLSETLREQGRYALILDDVWSSFPLEDIGINELTKVNGCIVLTTRSEEVIRSMGCKKVQVACLSMHDAMDLFLSKVGQDVSATPTLELFMKLVVGECDGLPLALVTLAASMKGISNPRLWKNVVNELRGYIRNIQDIEDKVFGSLKFSYDRLKKEDQDCFSYCALYPEDHQIEKKEIIQYWMEAGLIDEMGSRKAMEDNGHSILEKFEQNCLLERVENSAYVKMHDVFRDMALHINRKRFMVKAGKQLKELPNEEEWGEDLEKVSLMYNSISAIPQHMKCPKFPKLTTLLLSRNSLREIPESFFEHFPNLKILDLSHNPFESLPSSISALEKLTALLLNGCYNLESLPSVLKLQALKKLRLRGSGIKEIPQGLEMLVNLRYLDLLARHPILRNPEQMREFNKLQVFEGWFCNMGDWNMHVGQRKKLYKYSVLVCPLYPSRDIPSASSKLVVFERIEINSGDTVMLPYDIQQLHLKHCYGARSLNDIRLRDAIDLKECTVEDCFDLESIFSSKYDQLKKLKSLILRNLADLKVLVGVGESSLGTFSSLKEITLCSCPKIKKLFAADWALHNLEKIEVNYCLQLEEIITETEGEGMGTSNDSIKFNFPKLKTLILSNLRKLRGICSENAVMVCKSLQVIEISNCPKVKRIPLYLPQLEVDDEGQLSPFNTLQEIRVRTTDWWESVEWEQPNLNVKNVVQPLLKFCNRYNLEWRPSFLDSIPNEM